MLPWTRLSIDQSSLQGCTGVTLRRSDLQGGVHLVREHPHQSYPTQSSPSFGNQQRGHPPDYIQCTSGFGPNPNVLLHGAWLADEAKPKQLQIHNVAANKTTTPLPGAGRCTADV